MEAQLIEDPIEQKLGKRGSRKIDEWCKNWCGKMRGIFLSKVSYVMLLEELKVLVLAALTTHAIFFR